MHDWPRARPSFAAECPTLANSSRTAGGGAKDWIGSTRPLPKSAPPRLSTPCVSPPSSERAQPHWLACSVENNHAPIVASAIQAAGLNLAVAASTDTGVVFRDLRQQLLTFLDGLS